MAEFKTKTNGAKLQYRVLKGLENDHEVALAFGNVDLTHNTSTQYLDKRDVQELIIFLEQIKEQL